MLRVLYFLLPLMLTFSLGGTPLSIDIQCGSAVLINLETGKILFEKNAHELAFPASITKVATALYALKKSDDKLDQIVTVKPQALASITPQAKKQSNFRSPAHLLETDGTCIGLKVGEEISLRNLLCALLIGSANDAANVVAQHVGGTIPKFMNGLNDYLKEIGCQKTRFLNPHGFHHPDHVTTAYEMALIAREAMQHPLFRQIVSTVRMTCPPTNLEGERYFVQKNHLLRKGAYYYDKACGVKTGTTRSAGKTFIGAAEDGNRSLLVVLMKNQENSIRFQDAIKIFEAAFHEPKQRCTLFQKGAQNLQLTIRGAKTPLKTTLDEGLFYDFFPSEQPFVKAKVKWELPSLPIEKGFKVGRVFILDEKGKILNEQPLYALEKVEATWLNRVTAPLFQEKLGREIVCIVGVLSFVLFILFLRSKKPRRSY